MRGYAVLSCACDCVAPTRIRRATVANFVLMNAVYHGHRDALPAVAQTCTEVCRSARTATSAFAGEARPDLFDELVEAHRDPLRHHDLLQIVERRDRGGETGDRGRDRGEAHRQLDGFVHRA